MKMYNNKIKEHLIEGESYVDRWDGQDGWEVRYRSWASGGTRRGGCSTFIAFLMVFPVLYTNLLQGIRAADRNLLEMADVFRLSPGRRVRCIFLPALRPALFAGCRVALGLCWKAGVAAEVIGVVARSVGGKLYDAKAYLEIADLFAWTVVIVAVSALFERVFLFLLGKIFDALEHAV